MSRNGHPFSRAGMVTSGPASPADFGEQSRFAAGDSEELLTGSRTLRQAFRETPIRYAARDAMLVRLGERDAPILLLRSGFAYRSCVLADGRRAILDVLVPGDIAGLDHIMLASPIAEITAAHRVAYNALEPAQLRKLMADRCVALSVLAFAAEARWRGDRLTAMIGRLDAEARLAALILSIHDRLRRRGLTNHLSFNLPLTQEQIADHLGLTLVHVNRTLRRMREERLVLVDRQVVIIMDLDGLRELVRGLPQPAVIPEAAMPADGPPLGG
jgi:CRP/FNR family transcriptional regulator, anaerobic regulatory protein